MISQWLAGLLAGAVFGAIGMVVVLLYRVTRTLDFSIAAVGAWGLYVALVLVDAGLPYPVALLLGAAFAAALAAALAALIARVFTSASRTERCTVSIALLIALLALAFRTFGDRPRSVPALLPGGIDLGAVVVTADLALLLAGVLAIAFGLDALLGRSRIGFRLRALAERPVSTELLGVHVTLLQAAVAGLGGALACVCLALAAPTRPSDMLTLSLSVVPALAAAVIARLVSLKIALAAGLAIGALDGVAASVHATAGVRQAIVLAAVAAGLLWMQRHERWDTER